MANLKPRKRGRGAVPSVPDRAEEHAPVPASPGSLVELPLAAVRRYRRRYSLPIAPPATFPGFLLGGSVGRLSSAHTKYRRSSYGAAHKAVAEHLGESTVKEGDAIAEFLYTVQHRDEVLKLRFGPDDGASAAMWGAAYTAQRRAAAPPHDDAMDTAPAHAGAEPPYAAPAAIASAAPAPAAPATAESHIPLPVEPLPARANRSAEFTAVTARG